MVFSTSIPVYADPQNWNQQQTPETPKNAPTTGPTNRPASMTEQARMAKVPPPDPALPCPRCESTNTKFCYYNNYSLTQPRHFCKTCRRYWTRGGALRNVPVGGGLRRNKRSKSASKSSSSSATSAGGSRQINASSTGTTSNPNNNNASHLPFISPLHHMSHDFAAAGLPNLGLGFANMQPIDSLEYQVENSNNGLSIGFESWRIANSAQTPNQLPFLPGMYSLEGEGMMKLSTPGLITQFASVKMEDHNHNHNNNSGGGGNNNMSSLNLPRAFQMDNPGNNDIYCSGGATGFSTSCEVSGGWTMDLAGFNSASIQGNIL